MLTVINLRLCLCFKAVTDEQVFYDKFSYDKFYLPSARVYMQHILHDKFSCQQVYFDKFSWLTHTDEQNLHFDNFFYDKCTC